VRLARYFGGTEQFWLNLQSIYDLRTAERSAATKRALREIEPLEHSAAAYSSVPPRSWRRSTCGCGPRWRSNDCRRFP
jgi:hypothetical protein